MKYNPAHLLVVNLHLLAPLTIPLNLRVQSLTGNTACQQNSLFNMAFFNPSHNMITKDLSAALDRICIMYIKFTK